MNTLILLFIFGILSGGSLSVYLLLTELLQGPLLYLQGWVTLLISLGLSLTLSMVIWQCFKAPFAVLLARSIVFIGWVILLAGFEPLGIGRYNSIGFSLAWTGIALPAVIAHIRNRPKATGWLSVYSDGRPFCLAIAALGILFLGLRFPYLTDGTRTFLLTLIAVGFIGWRMPDVAPPSELVGVNS